MTPTQLGDPAGCISLSLHPHSVANRQAGRIGLIGQGVAVRNTFGLRNTCDLTCRRVFVTFLLQHCLRRPPSSSTWQLLQLSHHSQLRMFAA